MQIRQYENSDLDAVLSSWEIATRLFNDEYSSCVNDPDHSYEESRYLIFGVSTKGTHLVVSYTERLGIIRIISARCLTRQERKAYEER